MEGWAIGVSVISLLVSAIAAGFTYWWAHKAYKQSTLLKLYDVYLQRIQKNEDLMANRKNHPSHGQTDPIQTYRREFWIRTVISY